MWTQFRLLSRHTRLFETLSDLWIIYPILQLFTSTESLIQLTLLIESLLKYAWQTRWICSSNKSGVFSSLIILIYQAKGTFCLINDIACSFRGNYSSFVYIVLGESKLLFLCRFFNAKLFTKLVIDYFSPRHKHHTYTHTHTYRQKRERYGLYWEDSSKLC